MTSIFPPAENTGDRGGAQEGIGDSAGGDQPDFTWETLASIPVKNAARTGDTLLELAGFYSYNGIMQTEKSLTHIINMLREALPPITERYGVESLGLFGSYVRQAQRADSDFDLLVTFREPPSLLQFIELENYLSDLLGVKVDLVTKDGLKPGIRQHVLKEVVLL
jgi:hypothetical protein